MSTPEKQGVFSRDIGVSWRAFIFNFAMETTFDVVQVPDNAPDKLEYVGSKEKFWYERTDTGNSHDWLFKVRRLNTGEDWAEKVAAELSDLIGLPHAIYELAIWRDKSGVVTKRLEAPEEQLVLGNEILAGHVNRYPRLEKDRFYRNPQYTLDLMMSTLSDPDLNIQLDATWEAIEGVDSVPEAFLGYLLLDAWIGNTDRHDKNWGVLEGSEHQRPTRYLAPTFDHASSMGREVTNNERHERLTTKDKNRTVQAYVERCRSAFVLNEGDTNTVHPIDAFNYFARELSSASRFWLRRLENVDEGDVGAIFHRIPDDRISDVSITFAREILSLNREKLLETEK